MNLLHGCPRCQTIADAGKSKDLAELFCTGCGLPGLWVQSEDDPSLFGLEWADNNTNLLTIKTPEELARAYADLQPSLPQSMVWYSNRDGFLAGYESRQLHIERLEVQFAKASHDLNVTQFKLDATQEQYTLALKALKSAIGLIGERKR